MVVAQLVEQFLPSPEVRGSNQVIGEIYIEHCLLSTVLERRKNKKRPGMAKYHLTEFDHRVRSFCPLLVHRIIKCLERIFFQNVQ